MLRLRTLYSVKSLKLFWLNLNISRPFHLLKKTPIPSMSLHLLTTPLFLSLFTDTRLSAPFGPQYGTTVAKLGTTCALITLTHVMPLHKICCAFCSLSCNFTRFAVPPALCHATSQDLLCLLLFVMLHHKVYRVSCSLSCHTTMFALSPDLCHETPKCVLRHHNVRYVFLCLSCHACID